MNIIYPNYLERKCLMLPRDQFYTKKSIAKDCFSFFIENIKRLLNKNPDDLFFIEPSAGEGSFFDELPVDKRMGIDIKPKHPRIILRDFLTWNYKPFFHKRQDTVVIGNPPFGKRAQMAIQFFNRAAVVADIIAFILPAVFRKYRIHKLLNEEFAWIASLDLPRKAFYTEKLDDYEVNTEFQIWTRLSCVEKNMRLFAPPL